MVKSYHYTKGGSNTATFRHGIFVGDELVGGAWWIPPTKAAAKANWNGDWKKVLALSRLVCVPHAPRNSASYLMSASIRLIRKNGRFEYLLTYADEWQGHTGAIYKASNWDCLGKTQPEPVWVNADGRMMGRKHGPKTYYRWDLLLKGGMPNIDMVLNYNMG